MSETKCKYCRHPNCVAERYPDDGRVLRMCRHNVMLERDFFERRLQRYLPAEPAREPPAAEALVAADPSLGVGLIGGGGVPKLGALCRMIRQVNSASDGPWTFGLAPPSDMVSDWTLAEPGDGTVYGREELPGDDRAFDVVGAARRLLAALRDAEATTTNH